MQRSSGVRAITPSMTIGMDDRARKLRREGVDVISFAAGEQGTAQMRSFSVHRPVVH